LKIARYAFRTSLILTCSLRIAFLQTSSVKCEVASIKPAKSSDPRRREMEFLPGGRFRATNIPFFQVLATAYNIPWQSIEALHLRVNGIPDWMFSDGYDVEAKAENSPAASGASVKARNERIRLMLQSLLADRLKLRVRRETTEVQGFALVVGKSGPKMAKSKAAEETCIESVRFAPISASGPPCHQIQGGTGRGLHGTAIDMSDLALFVSNWSDRPVVDATGLTGLYAIETLGWSPSGDDPSRPSLQELLDRLGLKLANRRVRIETVVIEHVEKPAGN
jgi:uncharacterized protein (TIGR03435 family)